MSWSTVLFDLDGTLTDPGVGITKAVQRGLRAVGIEEPQLHKLRKFVGPPLHEAFAEFYGLDEQQVRCTIEAFRAYYNVEGWLENEPYPQIGALLQALRAAGKTLIVATSKPETTANRVLTHFDLAQYFDCICGAPPGITTGKKSEVIADAFARTGADASQAVMVGDRMHDVLGAHEMGIPAIGVLYGYGSREELQLAGAEFITESTASLQALLLR